MAHRFRVNGNLRITSVVVFLIVEIVPLKLFYEYCVGEQVVLAYSTVFLIIVCSVGALHYVLIMNSIVYEIGAEELRISGLFIRTKRIRFDKIKYVEEMPTRLYDYIQILYDNRTKTIYPVVKKAEFLGLVQERRSSNPGGSSSRSLNEP